MALGYLSVKQPPNNLFTIMPSKAVALRLPDHIYTAIDAECLKTGLTKSELILGFIGKCLNMETVIYTPLEVRMQILEDRVMSLEIDRHKVASETSEPSVDKDIWIAAKEPTAISAEPEQPEPKRSPVSSRDSGEAGTSTADIQQNIIAVLKPYPAGGCYFRSEQLGQTKILGTYRTQAMEMGFSSEVVSIDGEKIRVWLNRSYCLDSTATV
jgi:hypothetical protein